MDAPDPVARQRHRFSVTPSRYHPSNASKTEDTLDHDDYPEDCMHGMDLDSCVICKDRQLVWITAGGRVFHQLSNCELLDMGQDKAVDEGLKIHP